MGRGAKGPVAYPAPSHLWNSNMRLGVVVHTLIPALGRQRLVALLISRTAKVTQKDCLIGKDKKAYVKVPVKVWFLLVILLALVSCKVA